MATPRSRQYNPPGSGGGSDGGFGAILAALVGAPAIEGGDVTSSIDPEVDLGTSNAPVLEPYRSKPTLGQKIFNPRGTLASEGQATQMNANTALLNQDIAGKMDIENLRSQGNIKEKQEADRIAKDQFAREVLKVKDWNAAQVILQNPEVQAAAQKALLADQSKQDILNKEVQAKTQETLGQTLPSRVKMLGDISEAGLKQSTTERNKYFTLGKGDLLTNPSARSNLINAEAGQYENLPSGGPVNLQDSGEFAVGADGSLNRIVKKGGSNNVTVNDGSRTINTTPLKAKDEMPSFGGLGPIEPFKPSNTSLIPQPVLNMGSKIKEMFAPFKLPEQPYSPPGTLGVLPPSEPAAQPQGLFDSVGPVNQFPSLQPSLLEQFLKRMRNSRPPVYNTPMQGY